MIPSGVRHDAEVERLQAELAAIERSAIAAGGDPRAPGTPRYVLAESAKNVRIRLFELTGDWYGKPKAKLSRPSDELLQATYDSPEDVPPEVLQYERMRGALFADATDAQRWARIVGTAKHERLAGSVTIYRAVDDRAVDDESEIRPGDWVSTSRAYVEEHARRWFSGHGRVIAMDVDGSDVLASPTGNFEEAIYAPLELSGDLISRPPPGSDPQP